MTVNGWVRSRSINNAPLSLRTSYTHTVGVLLHVDKFAARVVSILCAMTFTWWGNRTLTFAEHAAAGQAGVVAELLKFMAANSVGAVANYAAYSVLVAVAPWPLSNPNLAIAAGVAVAAKPQESAILAKSSGRKRHISPARPRWVPP